MGASSPALRRATEADAALALSWSPSENALKRWAGPNAPWPTTAEQLWAHINTPDFTTFALEMPGHGLVGFGQIKLRDGVYGHLARIVVSPHYRGQGHGRTLCRALMREAPRLHAITAYSLFVYSDNTPAIALYRSLGFTDQGPGPRSGGINHMIAPLGQAIDKRGP